MYRIERYSDSVKNMWNDFVRSSENGHFMFLRSYMDYHSERFHDHSVLVFDEKKLKAILPANEIEDKVISHQGLTFGGLVLSPKTSCTETTGILKAICDYYREGAFKEFCYNAIPPVFHNRARQDDTYALTCLGFQLVRRDMSTVLDLSLPIRYRSTKKQNIKKGVGHDLGLERVGDLKLIWELISSVLDDRHSASPTHSLKEIQSLKDDHPKYIESYVVKNDEEILAAAVLFQNSNCVHTQYLATNTTGRDVGALDWLIDRLIDISKESYRYFSFGISTEDQGRILNKGLAFQKEGFGGRAVVHDFYQLEL